MSSVTYESLLLKLGVEAALFDQATADGLHEQLRADAAAHNPVEVGPLLLSRKLLTPTRLVELYEERDRNYVGCDNCGALLRVRNFRPGVTLTCPSCSTNGVHMRDTSVVLLAAAPSLEARTTARASDVWIPIPPAISTAAAEATAASTHAADTQPLPPGAQGDDGNLIPAARAQTDVLSKRPRTRKLHASQTDKRKTRRLTLARRRKDREQRIRSTRNSWQHRIRVARRDEDRDLVKEHLDAADKLFMEQRNRPDLHTLDAAAITALFDPMQREVTAIWQRNPVNDADLVQHRKLMFAVIRQRASDLERLAQTARERIRAAEERETKSAAAATLVAQAHEFATQLRARPDFAAVAVGEIDAVVGRVDKAIEALGLETSLFNQTTEAINKVLNDLRRDALKAASTAVTSPATVTSSTTPSRAAGGSVVVHAGVVAPITTPAQFELALAESKAGQVPLVVHFHADWCAPCRTMAPMLAKLAGEWGGRARSAAVDVDSATSVAQRFEVRGLPTIIVFDATGKDIARRMGLLREADLRSLVEQHLPAAAPSAPAAASTSPASMPTAVAAGAGAVPRHLDAAAFEMDSEGVAVSSAAHVATAAGSGAASGALAAPTAPPAPAPKKAAKPSAAERAAGDALVAAQRAAVLAGGGDDDGAGDDDARENTATYQMKYGHTAPTTTSAMAVSAADPDDIESRRKPVMTADDVVARLQAGQPVMDVRVRELNLSGLVFEKKVVLERIDFGSVQADGTVFRKQASFKGSRFDQRAVFGKCVFEHEADFKSTFYQRGADFKRCVFQRKVSFNYAQFPQHGTFKGCLFEKEAILSNISFDRGIDISDTTAKSNFGLAACTVGFRSDFSNCTFEGTTTFSNTVFNDVVDFSRSKFLSETKFFTTTLNKPAKFHYTRFAGPLLFAQANIEDDANFNGATFEHEISFESTRSRGAVRLTGAELNEKCVVSLKNCQIEKLHVPFEVISAHLKTERDGKLQAASDDYAYLKRNYQALTEYDSEDRAYYAQRRLARIASAPQTPYKKGMKFLEWTALDLACGYGTKPINILWTFLILLGGFALFFLLADALVGPYFDLPGADTVAAADATAAADDATDDPRLHLGQAIVFSFKTLFNAEIGDIKARPDTWLEYVVMLQSALGFGVLMLLVATFSRKVVR